MAIENNQIDNSNIDNDKISLKEIKIYINSFLNLLKQKQRLFLIVSLLGAGIGIGIALFDQPNYKAVLTFAMEEEKGSGNGGGLNGALGIASSLGIDLGGGGGGAFAVSNLSELMKSRTLVERILLKPFNINGKIITLAEYYIQIKKLRHKWRNKINIKNVQFLPGSDRTKYTLQQDSLLGVFHKSLIEVGNLNILQKDKKVTVLSIEVNSNDEIFSKIFCENIAQETSNFYIQTKSKKARINVYVLQKQVDSVRTELNQSVTSVASETDFVYNLNPAFNIKGTPSKKRQIDVQANTAILTNLVVQLELAKINLRKETPLIQIIDLPILPLEKNEFSIILNLLIGALLASFITIIYFLIKKLF